MKALLGIDLGTSATKTVLFDEQLRPLASASSEYPLHQPHNGWAEQDPQDWWKAAVETVNAVLQKSGVAAGDIAAVGISGQMHGLVMLDADGEVLRPSIIWCDQRTAAECVEITNLVGAGRMIEITANPALTGFTASKIMWVKKHQPEIYAKCRHILLPKDYLRYKLTGEFATEVSDASGMQLLDVPKRRWSEEVLTKLDIDPSLLAKVYESPEITGTVSGEAARATGLSVKTVVVGGAGDNAAAAVGTGVVTDGKAFTTIGTSGVVFAHTDNVTIDPQGRVHTFCCAVPGAWHVMGVTQAAGLSLKWFREQSCMDLNYRQIDDLAMAVPIGARRLLYLPYLMGERTPHLDADCRGVFFGLSGMHTRPDMLRAVMEGVAYSLRDCVEVLRGMGVQTSEMLACGGGGTSALWRQMLADLFNCDVRTATSQEGPALGVAILAGVGAGLFKSVPDACAELLRFNDPQPPVAANAKEYETYYGIYKTLYPALKENFAKLAAV
ncbi:MAG: xylulokinase [Oscillospiraceae bacterium]|jgi:xylulokinase|nr:xylulokinase [Oscillospiraceae bacterium]